MYFTCSVVFQFCSCKWKRYWESFGKLKDKNGHPKTRAWEEIPWDIIKISWLTGNHQVLPKSSTHPGTSPAFSHLRGHSSCTQDKYVPSASSGNASWSQRQGNYPVSRVPPLGCNTTLTKHSRSRIPLLSQAIISEISAIRFWKGLDIKQMELSLGWGIVPEASMPDIVQPWTRCF